MTIALHGDYGMPRSALIIQTDQFADLGSVTILPITSTLVDAPLLRLTVEASADNGLHVTSQIMLDKLMTVKAEKLGPSFGQIDETTMVSVNRSLALFLGLAG